MLVRLRVQLRQEISLCWKASPPVGYELSRALRLLSADASPETRTSLWQAACLHAGSSKMGCAQKARGI